MLTTTAPADPPAIADGGVDAGPSASGTLPADAALAGLVAAMTAADRAMVRVVEAARTLDGVRAAREEGMTIDAAVRLHTGATRGDVNVVLTAADVLARMPATAGLFARGVVSWGHVRALTAGVRGLDRDARARLDDYLGAHADRLARMDTDGRLTAIDDALATHRPTERVQDRADATVEARFAVLNPRLDGTGTVYADLDPEGFATVADRLQAEADAPQAAPSPGDDDTRMPRYAREAPVSRGRQLADALVRLCGRHPSPDGRGTPVRFTVIVDLDRVTDTVAGTIAPAVASRPPRLVRRAIERLTCDAAFDVIVRDGVDLIAAQRYRPEVSASTRRAVIARDGGCRFPGCRAPAAWCDVHHVVPRAAGGDHALTELVLLCRRHHTVVHRRGWQQHLTRDGTYTITRHGRTWTTLPRRAANLPPPDTPPPRAGVAPIPDPPIALPF